MANEAPDLSRIVNLILSNPKLIEEISQLAKNEHADVPSENTVSDGDVSGSGREESTAEVSMPPAESATAPITESVTASAAAKLHRETRSHLLSALKPYLSENRRKAVDSMLQIADLLDVFKTVT